MGDVGDTVGPLGAKVGTEVGGRGISVGTAVGLLGIIVGASVGRGAVGGKLGIAVGYGLGSAVGENVGADGTTGTFDGFLVGYTDGVCALTQLSKIHNNNM